MQHPHLYIYFTISYFQSIDEDVVIDVPDEYVGPAIEMLGEGIFIVLNEEKLLKRLGIGLPFLVELNKYFMDYGMIDKYHLTNQQYKLLFNYFSLEEFLETHYYSFPPKELIEEFLRRGIVFKYDICGVLGFKIGKMCLLEELCRDV